MDKAALRGVFDWGRCQSCMMVSEGWDSLPPSSVPCPYCGEKGFGADWPPQPARPRNSRLEITISPSMRSHTTTIAILAQMESA